MRKLHASLRLRAHDPTSKMMRNYIGDDAIHDLGDGGSVLAMPGGSG